MMNPRELDILNILWKSGRPMTSMEIINEGKGLSQSTVQTVLRKLLKGGLVKVVGITHSGNVLSRTFEPEAASRDLILQHFVDDYQSFSKIVSKGSLVSAMLQLEPDKNLNRREIDELRQMLEDYENTL